MFELTADEAEAEVARMMHGHELSALGAVAVHVELEVARVLEAEAHAAVTLLVHHHVLYPQI
jgi:hypothetical protein